MADESIARYSLFGVYDLAVSRWITAIMKTVTNEGLVIAATPMRAFSEARKVIKRNTPPDQQAVQTSDKTPNIPLPLISMQRGALEPREGRSYGAQRVGLSLSDESGRQLTMARPPSPFWLSYDIEIWSKTINVQSQLITNICEAFDTYLSYGKADFGDPYGLQMMAIRFGGVSDTSELEGGEDADRLIRNVLSIRVEGWQYHIPEKVLTALTVNVGVQTSVTLNSETIDWPRYDKIYIQAFDSSWYKMFLDLRGELFIVPAKPPTVEGTYNLAPMDKKYIIFPHGILLNDAQTKRSFRLTYNERAPLDVSYHPSNLTTSMPLVISKEQQVMIGDGDGGMIYGVLNVENGGIQNLTNSIYIP